MHLPCISRTIQIMKQILFALFLFLFSLGCHQSMAQSNFSDYINISNSNIIMYYFNSDLFLPLWPQQWRETNGRIIVRSKPSAYKTRVCKKVNGHLLIDSMEYMNSGGSEYELVRNTHMDVDLAGKTFYRSDIAAWGDSLGIATLQYDNLGRLNFISYKLFPGWIANDLKDHHYLLYYSDKTALIDSIAGYTADGKLHEKRKFIYDLNIKDSVLLVKDVTDPYNDLNNSNILQINKSGDTLKVTNYQLQGKLAYGSEFIGDGDKITGIYSHYSPTDKFKKEILHKIITTKSKEQTITEKISYENFPKETSRERTEFHYTISNQKYLLLKYFVDGKLDIVIEENWTMYISLRDLKGKVKIRKSFTMDSGMGLAILMRPGELVRDEAYTDGEITELFNTGITGRPSLPK